MRSQRRSLDKELRRERERAKKARHDFVRALVAHRKTVPVVIGPGGRECFMIDHHHWARVVSECEELHDRERQVLCRVVRDMSW